MSPSSLRSWLSFTSSALTNPPLYSWSRNIGTPMEEINGEHKTKRARIPTTVVKQEREASVDGGGEGAAGALMAVEVEAAMDQAPLLQIKNAMVEASFLHCTACLLPLKPPVFKCEAGHAVCCSCHGYHCHACNRATSYRHSGDLDAFVAAVKVPCPYEGFGCKAYVVYHGAADHQRECPCAPCYCPEPGCGFLGSPAMLLGHSAAVHSWPITEVRYGRPHKLAVPAPPSQRWHVLVGEEDRCLFLMSLGALGPATGISLVCVRATTGAPRYKCKLWVEVAGNSDDHALVTFRVGSSDLSRGCAAAEQGMFLTVPPGLLHSGHVPGEMLFPLNIRVDKLRSATS